MADQQNQTPQSLAAEDAAVEFNLSELFYRLLERWYAIGICAIAGVALAAAYTFALVTPLYEATAKMYVMNQGDSAINLSDLQIGSYLTSDYQEVFKTWEVHEGVISKLGLPYSYSEIEKMLTVTNPGNTRILYITATSDDPVEAQDIANEYVAVARQYISETMDTKQPSIMSYALRPTKPVSPNKTMNLLIGLALGALAAICFVLVRFFMDDKIKTGEDITKYTGLTTLAVVPALKSAGMHPQKRAKRN